MKKNTTKLAHTPNVMGRGKKTGIDDYSKKKGTKATKKLFDQAATLSGSVKLKTRFANEVKIKPIDYLWKPYIPKAKLSGAKGFPKSGKSFVAISIAAALSRGKLPGLNGNPCEPVTTLYFSFEGDPDTSTVPRFIAMGGDTSRLVVVDGAEDENGKPCSITLADVEAIKETIEKYKAGFVVIDPLQSYLGAKVDMHRANETRPILDGLSQIAKQTGAAIHVIRHVRKDNGGARSINSGLGSQDIVAAFRSEFLVGTDPTDRNKHALIHDAANDTREGQSLGFVLEGKVLKDEDGRHVETAIVKWTGTSPLTARDMLSAESPVKQGTKKASALAYLLGALTGGPRPMKELEAESGLDEQTLQRAKRASGNRVINAGYNKERQRVWKLAVEPPRRKFEAGFRGAAKDG